MEKRDKIIRILVKHKKSFGIVKVLTNARDIDQIILTFRDEMDGDAEHVTVMNIRRITGYEEIYRTSYPSQYTEMG